MTSGSSTIPCMYYATKKRVLDSIADDDLREMVSYELPAVVSNMERRGVGGGLINTNLYTFAAKKGFVI